MLLVLRVLLSLATTRLNTQNRKGRIKPQSLLKHPEGLTEKYKITIITLDHMTRSAPLTQFHRKQEWKLTYVEPRGLTWMLIDWDRSGRTGKCLARGHDAVLGLLGALGPYVLNSSQLLSLPALPLSQWLHILGGKFRMQPFTVPTLCVDTGIDQTVLELRWLELQREVKGRLQLSLDQFFFIT